MAFLIILGLILLAILIWASNDFFNIVYRGFAPLFPFFTINTKMTDLILHSVTLKPNVTIFELGAGPAKFLQAAEKIQPQANLIGIEYSLVPYLIGKFLLKKVKSNIKLIQQNLYKTDISHADLIYCYLIPSMMGKLAEKVKKECRSGTLIISYMFSIPGLELKKTIQNNNETTYIYEI
ncbi:MAG: rRNA adenine N-6-methyltransferase family protein [Candidatus Falkowbacteria bacterium]